jgi:beta-phosphoglucomutase-like phosphatase (HAD superfamily)
LNLLHHFQFVVTEDMVNRSKPSPEPYLLGLKMIGLNADECLVIEDSPRGLQAANAAGVTCIVLRNKMMLDHAFVGAHRVVDSVDQLAQEISQLI